MWCTKCQRYHFNETCPYVSPAHTGVAVMAGEKPRIRVLCPGCHGTGQLHSDTVVGYDVQRGKPVVRSETGLCRTCGGAGYVER